MNPDAMITTLKTMKLHGMADAVGELSEAILTGLRESCAGAGNATEG